MLDIYYGINQIMNTKFSKDTVLILHGWLHDFTVRPINFEGKYCFLYLKNWLHLQNEKIRYNNQNFITRYAVKITVNLLIINWLFQRNKSIVIVSFCLSLCSTWLSSRQVPL